MKAVVSPGVPQSEYRVQTGNCFAIDDTASRMDAQEQSKEGSEGDPKLRRLATLEVHI